MIRVDGYSTRFPPQKFFRDDGGPGALTNPLRWDESNGPLPVRSACDDEVSRWSGYVYYTKPHDDGECDQHRPQQRDWIPGEWRCPTDG